MFDENWIKQNIQQNNLFQKAFTHRSFLNESNKAAESNERLEFLGDCVLSFIMSTYLFNKRPNDNEGDLTNLRSFTVKTTSLAKAAERLNLGSFLRLSKGEEMSGGRENPQLLANTFEALLGAIYLELGIDAATDFISQALIPLFSNEIEHGPPKDAKSQLQEVVQNKTKQSPKYKILNTIGPDHAKQFVVGVYVEGQLKGQGTGLSKQIAEEESATQALQTLSKKNKI